jgi:uncharacterized surface protein with fasciclin (FAS1) repeats
MKKIFTMAILLFTSLTLLAQQSIVDVAREAGSFNTLLAAAQAAGLAETLDSGGPFTVFAPTDEAFAKLPSGTVEALLQDPETLANILLYHVVPGRVFAEKVLTQKRLLSLYGPSISVSVQEGAFVNDSRILATDIEADNGVIHVIDAVILPPTKSIITLAEEAGAFSTLLAAVDAAGLTEVLQGAGNFTVFAPTDEAFAQLPEGTVAFLLDNPEALADILLYHVLPQRAFSEQVIRQPRSKTLQGSFMTFEVRDQVTVDQAAILATDIEGVNGVIHVIDQVITPQSKFGQAFEISITNLTRGQTFAPPLLLAHDNDLSLFQLGKSASGSLKALAETGNTQTAIQEFKALEGVYDFLAFPETIAPGETATLTYKTAAPFPSVTVAGMLTATNDSFFWSQLISPGLNGFLKQGDFRAVHDLAWAYDAGTEFNSESCEDVPGGDCGGSGNPGAGEGFVYFSQGINGDGDLDRAEANWQGPVALIQIKRL